MKKRKSLMLLMLFWFVLVAFFCLVFIFFYPSIETNVFHSVRLFNIKYIRLVCVFCFCTQFSYIKNDAISSWFFYRLRMSTCCFCGCWYCRLNEIKRFFRVDKKRLPSSFAQNNLIEKCTQFGYINCSIQSGVWFKKRTLRRWRWTTIWEFDLYLTKSCKYNSNFRNLFLQFIIIIVQFPLKCMLFDDHLK